LSVILSRVNKKSIKSNEEFDKEYIIVKCIKHILNSENVDEKEADDISSLTSMAQKNKSHVIKTLIFSVISPRLATRILVTELKTLHRLSARFTPPLSKILSKQL